MFAHCVRVNPAGPPHPLPARRPRRVRKADGSEVLVGCTENCLNRLSYIHCDPRTCPCGTACTNKPFHLLKPPPLETFLTDNRGHGVRLTQPLDKGQFVVEYAGEVSTHRHRTQLSATVSAAACQACRCRA